MSDDVQPLTLTEITDCEADYLRTAMTLDWRKRRRARRDIADGAFLRLVATVRMYAAGCVGLAAQLPRGTPPLSERRSSSEEQT